VSVDGESDDPQCANMQGVWKDTIFAKPGYHVIARTRYQRYIGEFVLHCHILDHEDQGMTQNVRIALPDGMGLAGHRPAVPQHVDPRHPLVLLEGRKNAYIGSSYLENSG
jgi:hypothetical protein